jgi:nitroreductase
VTKISKKKLAPKKPKAKAKSAKQLKKKGPIEKVARAAGWVAGAIQGSEPDLLPTRDLFGSIKLRRSHKKFKPGPVDAVRIRLLLDAAVMAPNHKLTQPWGFLVFGQRAKHVYAETKARLKLGDHMGVEGRGKAETMIADVLAIPTIIGVTQKQDQDPIRREEDYAAVFMAIQNLLLAATAMGLGTKIHTGDILDDAQFRDAIRVAEDERLVAIIDVGEPLEELPPKNRVPAADKTRWLD